MSQPSPAPSPSDAPPAPEKAKPAAAKVAAGFLLPLFFLIGLPLSLVSAFHAPAPHEMALLVVGPNQVVSKIAAGLDDTPEFDVTHTDVESEATSSVEQRRVVGAIEITVGESASQPASADATTGSSETADPQPTFSVTAYVANAGGRSAAAAVQAAASQVASQLGTTSDVVDVAPLSSKDTLGTTLFYLLTYSSLGGYLVIVVLTQVRPGSRLRTRYLAVSIAAVALPLLVFGLASPFVGDYGATFGTITALLGVMAISIFTVGSLAILVQQFLGNAATFGIMLMVVFLNFPSAGGAVPASMLPPFWQGMHQIWFGAGAFESFRSIVYFDGNGVSRYLPQLLAWTVGVVLLTIIVELAKLVVRQRREIGDLRLTSPTQQTLQVERRPRHTDPRTEEPQSLTTGTEAVR